MIALKKPFFGPHGDEQRDPPPNAPSKPPLADLRGMATKGDYRDQMNLREQMWSSANASTGVADSCASQHPAR